MSEAKAQLRALLESIFEDGVVDVEEHHALKQWRDSDQLSAAEVQATFASFLNTKFDEAMSDGKISLAERRLIATIVTELRVPDTAVPVHVRMMLQD